MYKGSTVNPGTSGSYYGRNVTATGTYSFAGGYWSTASGSYSTAMGTRTIASNTHAMAFGIDVRATANRAMIIGTGVGNGSSNAMINSTARSLMIGFNSNIPTMFVGSSSGLNTIGRVGIGTSSPGALLDVRGVSSNPNMRLTSASNKYLEFGIADCNGCYGTYANPGDAVMRVLGGGDLIFSIPGTNGNRKIAFHSGGDKIMTVQEVGTSGKVGIGTTNFPTTIGGANISAYRLFVKGGILTEELRVRTGWADYVFEDNYQLKPLSEVEAYINENGHLPNVPSATEVEEEGISVGEMTKIQQEKIEELTLYIIEMKKEVEALKARLNDQENK